MTNGDTKTAPPEPKFKLNKRGDGSKCERLGPDGVCIALISKKYLKEVIMNVDVKDRVGNVTFVPNSGKPIERDLVYSILPQGRWVFKHLPPKNTGGNGWDLEFVEGKTEWTVYVKELKYLVRNRRNLQLLTYYSTSPEDDIIIDDLYLSSIGREVVYTVNYYFDGKEVSSVVTKQGYVKKLFSSKKEHAFFIPRRLYIKKNLENFEIPLFAKIYMIMLEHFAGINVPLELSDDGLTSEELSEIYNIKSKYPNMDPMKIANITAQGITDYYTALDIPVEETNLEQLDSMIFMIETILNQTKLNNPLGTNNLMQIGKGQKLFPGNSDQNNIQIGIIIYGRGMFLLYDEYGYPVLDFSIAADPYHRSVDVSKIDSAMNTLEEGDLGTIRHLLWHSVGLPVVSAEQLAEYALKYLTIIAKEVFSLYGGKFKEVFLEMDWTVYLAFIALGVASVWAMSGVFGASLAICFLILAQLAGYVLFTVSILTYIDDFTRASYHFCRMEEINRIENNEKGRERLTHLSQYHLDKGANYLAQALARLGMDLVFLAVSYGTGKVLPKASRAVQNLEQRVKLTYSRRKAHFELRVDENGKVMEIIPLKEEKLFGDLSDSELKKLLKRVNKRSRKGKKDLSAETLQDMMDKIRSERGKSKTSGKSKAGKKGGKSKKGKPKDRRIKESNLRDRRKGQKAAGQRKQRAARQKARERREGTKQDTAPSRGKFGRKLDRRREQKQKKLWAKERKARASGGTTFNVLKGGAGDVPVSHAYKVREYDYSKHTHAKVENEGGKTLPADHPMVTGVPDEVLNVFIKLADEHDWVIILRTTNNRGVQFMGKGYKSKGKNLIALNTDPETGKVTIKTPEKDGVTYAKFEEQCKIAQDNGYYILKEDGFAHRTGKNGKDEVFIDPVTKEPKKFDFDELGAHGEKTNRPWQIIDDENGLAIIGDVDLQDIFSLHSPGRNVAPAPESIYENVDGLYAEEVRELVNTELIRLGYEKLVQHGADYQFMSYLHFRSESIKGDTIVILPSLEGKRQVFYFTAKDLQHFYDLIHRSRLELEKSIKLTNYKKDNPE